VVVAEKKIVQIVRILRSVDARAISSIAMRRALAACRGFALDRRARP